MKPFWKRSQDKEPTRHIVSELLGLYVGPLRETSFKIVFDTIEEYKKFNLSGDTSRLLNLKDEQSIEEYTKLHPYYVIEANSIMEGMDLKVFISMLVDKLQKNEEKVRGAISDDNLYTIECFKDNEWKRCVAIAPRGRTLG